MSDLGFQPVGNSVLEAIEGLECQILHEVRGRRFGMPHDWFKQAKCRKDETASPRLLGYFGPQSRCGNTKRASLRVTVRKALALKLPPLRHIASNAKAKTLRELSSNTLTEMFDEFVSATPFTAFRRTYIRLIRANYLVYYVPTHTAFNRHME